MTTSRRVTLLLLSFPTLARADWVGAKPLWGTSPVLDSVVRAVVPHVWVSGGARQGSFGTPDGSIKRRGLVGAEASASLGWNVGPLIFGANGGFGRYQQTTATARVGQTNVSGDLTSYGPLAGVSVGRLLLTGEVVTGARYQLANLSSQEERVTYDSPTSSYKLTLNYRLGRHLYLGVDYSSLRLKRERRDGVNTQIPSGKQIHFDTLGVQLGFSF